MTPHSAVHPTPQPPSAESLHLADLRKSYERAALDETASQADPLQQFLQWLQEAIDGGIPEPTAMTLATVDSRLRPSSRVVLLKGCDARGLAWYTNYDSRKGRELAGNPYASLQFHWVELERVVRIEGRVEKTSEAESDAYFQSRPLGSRIGAWASPQSRVVAGRQVLEERAARAQAELGDQPPRPPHWGGYRLVPDSWEFWQGRRSRLHDRLHYRQDASAATGPQGDAGTGTGWIRERLAP